MFYVLAMATILSSIFVYALYPRSDGVQTMDIPSAKAPATELVTQHMAALTASKVLVKDENGKTIMQYNNWLKLDSLKLTPDKFKEHMEDSAYRHNNSFEYIHSKIYIVNNKDGQLLNDITASKDSFGFDYGTSDFLITYVSFEDLAAVHGDLSARLTGRALGEISHFVGYETPAISPNGRHETFVTAATFCGQIQQGSIDGDFDPHNDSNMYVLSDTRTSLVSLPRVFTAGLNEPTEYFACITRLKAKHIPILKCSDYKTDTECNNKIQCQWISGSCKKSEEDNFGIIYPRATNDNTGTPNNGGTEND